MTDQDASVTTVRVGLLGCGTVGTSIANLIHRQRDEIATRTGIRLDVTRIAVRDLSVDRGIELAHPAAEVFTGDAMAVAVADDVDVVIELIGGVDLPRTLISAALDAGKPVVTGNKALLADHGAELFAKAEANRVDLLFEAAVAAGIPLMRPLRESLLGEPIRRVLGIINGTTNFILTKMTEEGASYDETLAEAQALGYAEADPTADVEGFDAGAKAAIIATIAFGVEVVADDVHHEGISTITASDIEYATRSGHVIKLIATAERVGEADEVAVRVHPTLVPLDHPLAAVRDSFNAVFIEGGAVGELMLYGRGAGGDPTASAVLGDLIDAASNLRSSSYARFGPLPRASVQAIEQLIDTCYSLTILVTDEPGVLSKVADAFGRHNVSIRSMEQEGLDDEARLIFITHEAAERDVRETLAELKALDSVRDIGSVLRVVSS